MAPADETPARDATPRDATPRSDLPPTLLPAGSPHEAEQVHAQVGPYRLLEVIGEGGFGTVWMAERRDPMVQRVALKIIKAGMDTRAVVARFEQERQALAMMDHPNIAKVLDAGATASGRPYFVMELCRGEPMTEFCDKHNLTIRERLELFVQVCQAVQHAHQKGLIHRDIKPSNILVSMHDGTPVPKVIDFGIAKATAGPLTEKTLVTRHRQLIGTPEYMSPEQAEGSPDIDTRTDVYSLGVLLYELLTGATPFDSRTLRSAADAEIQRIIREVDPPRPSARLSSLGAIAAEFARRRRIDLDELRRALHRELEWIPLKAMRKDRGERYRSASELADDVRNYLRGLPLLAGPESAAYRARKFVRRRRGLVAATAAVALALVAAVVGTGIGYFRAEDAAERERHARETAEQQRRRAEATASFLQDMLSSIDPERSGGREPTVKDLVDDAAKRLGPALSEDPVTEAMLRETLGETYFALARYQESKEQLARALELRTKALGPADRETLTSAFNIAAAELMMGNIEAARRDLEKNLADRTAALGAEAPDTLATRSMLAQTLQMSGDLEAALVEYGRTLEIQERVVGLKEKATLETMASVADTLQHLGRLEDADRTAQKLVDAAMAAQGADGPTTLMAKSIRASILKDLSRYEESEKLNREVLASKRRIYGADHPHSLTTENSLALALEMQRKYDEARTMLRHCLDAASRSLGVDHDTTVTYLANLARQEQLLGNLDEAERLMRQALETRRRTLGEQAQPTLVVMNNLGLLLLDRKKPQEAEPIFRAMLAGIQKALPEKHWMQGQAMLNVAECLVDQQRYEEAEKLELAGYESLTASLPAGHQRLKDAAKAISTLYEKWGKPEQAASWKARAAP
ncbi:MAG: serine/threonine-protein kinase [Phycisphaerales bacterium]